MKEVKLPSGATLKVGLAPFSDSKELLQAITQDLLALKIDGATEVDYNLLKDIICTGVSSKRVEACVEKCWAKCLYNGIRITADTFESEEARQDYLTVFYEVAVANVAPFMKSLSSRLQPLFSMMRDIRPSL